MGFIDLFPKDKNRETEVSRGFRFFGDRGTPGIVVLRHKKRNWLPFVAKQSCCRNNLENISDEFLFVMDSCRIFAVSKRNR